LVDDFGRRLRYLRLSVTDRCNLSCHYCNPVKGCLGHEADTLSWDDLSFLVDCCVGELGMEAIRITGGEPTVRPGLIEWIRSIRGHAALQDISMTTNGVLLSRMAEELASAGLDRVNVSLDTWDAGRFAQITRGGSLPRVLEGLHAAIRTFARVKINCVSLKGVTIPEIEEYVRFSHEHSVEVRFIELMPLFDQKEYFRQHFLPTEELMRAFEDLGYRLVAEADEGPAARNRTGYGPATTWAVEGTRARIGFISQMSDTKCLTCNKLRLTSDGALKPCLLMPEEVDLLTPIKSRDRGAIVKAMTKAFLDRADRYDAQTALEKPVGRPMQATGG
jgi:cyclic pyranopterin phosphate synthase